MSKTTFDTEAMYEEYLIGFGDAVIGEMMERTTPDYGIPVGAKVAYLLGYADGDGTNAPHDDPFPRSIIQVKMLVEARAVVDIPSPRGSYESAQP